MQTSVLNVDEPEYESSDLENIKHCNPSAVAVDTFLPEYEVVESIVLSVSTRIRENMLAIVEASSDNKDFGRRIKVFLESEDFIRDKTMVVHLGTHFSSLVGVYVPAVMNCVCPCLPRDIEFERTRQILHNIRYVCVLIKIDLEEEEELLELII